MRGRTHTDKDRHPNDPQVGTFEALAAALDHYRRGESDLRLAAEEAGLDEWDILQEAKALPDPIAPAHGHNRDLPTFVRERR